MDYCSQPFSFKKPNVSYHKIRPFILRHASYPVCYKLCCTGAAAGVVHKHQTEVKRHVRTGLVVLHRLHQRVVVDLHYHESMDIKVSFTRTVNVTTFCEQQLFLKNFWGHQYFCWVTDTRVGLLVTSALRLKARVDSLACGLLRLHATDSSEQLWSFLTDSDGLNWCEAHFAHQSVRHHWHNVKLWRWLWRTWWRWRYV